MIMRSWIAATLATAALLGLLLFINHTAEPEHRTETNQAPGDTPSSNLHPSAPTIEPVTRDFPSSNDQATAITTGAATSEDELTHRLRQLRAREEELRGELDALRLAGETREHFVRRCSMNAGYDCPRAHPPPDVLDERAKCGTIAWDDAGSLEIEPSTREELSITEREMEVLRRANERIEHEVEQRMAENFRQATGEEPPGPDAFPSRVMALSIELGKRVPDVEAVPQLAKELAGQEPRPSRYEDRSPYYWHMRIRLESGDRLEQAVAEELGADRAREIRMARGGWNSGTMYSAGLCHDR